MKKKLFSLLLLAPLLTLADPGDVPLAWTASATPGCTNILYAHTNALTATNLALAAVKLNVGTNCAVTVQDPAPARWWFAVTATKDGLESAPSNILQVEVPKPPANLRVIHVQYGSTISNFTDAGFFRLRIQ